MSRPHSLVSLLVLVSGCTSAPADVFGAEGVFAMDAIDAIPIDGDALPIEAFTPARPRRAPIDGPLPDAVFAGPRETCARRDGDVTCFGGTFATDPVARAEPELRDAVHIAIGWSYLCVIRRDHRVACRGHNGSGQLGLGPDVEATDELRIVPGLEDIVALAVDQSHSCAVTAAGEAWCWGGNRFGEAGDGSVDATAPWRPSSGTTPVRVALDGVRSIAVGSYHTCTLRGGGEVHCFGYDSYGQLGVGRTRQIATSTPRRVDLPPAVAISAQGNSTCALLASGEVHCWGRNTEGQLGSSGEEQCVVIVDHPCASRPRRVEGVSGAVALAFGGQHGCTLDAERDVTCFGSNERGALGATDASSTDPAVHAGWSALHLAVGSQHTCVMSVDGTLRCFGRGTEGQLGTGGLEDAPAPIEIASR